MNGDWFVSFAESARYRFTLRRYPREADFELSGAYPATKREFYHFPECKALPITNAQVLIDGVGDSASVTSDMKSVSIELDVVAGDHIIQTFFFDKLGEELCGAYYLAVEKL